MIKKAIVFNSSTSLLFNQILTSDLTKNISIKSFIENNVEYNLEEKNKKNEIGYREAAWIRVIDINNIFTDYLATNIFFIVSKKGIYIESLGDVISVDLNYVVNDILDFTKNKKISINEDYIYEYKKHSSQKIKNNFNFLINKKNDFAYNKLEYLEKRKNAKNEHIKFNLLNKYISEWESQIKERIERS